MTPALRWLAVGLFCSALSAQQISPSLFSGLNWRLIGPFRGGRSVAVTGIAGDGRTFYFGSVDGGVWRTTDAGTVWEPIFDGQPVASIGALEVAPSDPNILYAGTGESDIRSDLASGNGIYKSTDGGKSWHNFGLRETRHISRIAVDPKDPNRLFVAALGHAYAANDDRGVFRSLDGGQSWEKVLHTGPALGAADIAMAPDAPQILFASLWNAHRVPWSTYAPVKDLTSLRTSGLYRSIDGGKTWTECTAHGLPENRLAHGGWGRLGVGIARGTGGKRVYALIEADTGEEAKSGLYRSDDGGDNWTLVNNDPRITSRAWYFSSITADPNNPDIVYIPNVAFYKLSDGGKTLYIVRGAPGGDDYHQVWIDPADSRRMVLGTDQGTTVSLDGGVTWSTWYNQPTAQFYHVITDNQFPYHVYGSQQDSGTAAVPIRTDHGQIDGRDWFTVGGGESGYIAPDPKDPNIIYSSGSYGEVSRFDKRTMQSHNIAPWPVPNFKTEIVQRKYRDPWTPALVFSLKEPEALYLGTQFVMKTVDGGLHWQPISPDLTGARLDPHLKADAPVNPDNAVERGYGVVYSIAPSPLDAKEIWAGSDTGLLHLTRDAGKTWQDVTPQMPLLSKWSKITHIELSHSTAGEAYVAVDRHRLDDMHPYLLRTTDFGKSWTPITNGIADTAFLNAIREDPVRKGLLFAGTEFGVYVSFDDGDHWQTLQANLPVTSVRDLVIHDSDLIVATHGRSFWVMDDISLLRQINEEVTGASAWLFKPEPAVRMTSDAFPGTPLPPEEPQAANPPRGAYLDYYLGEGTNRAITVQIRDSQGKEVRRYSSADKPPPPPANLPIASRWFPSPQRLSTEPGMHRFVWDLRSGPAGANESGDDDGSDMEQSHAPLVLPGSYTVKLTVNGHDLLQPVEVVMDPRSQATPADLVAQFELSRKAFQDMLQARTAVAELTVLQKWSKALKLTVKPPQKTLLANISRITQRSDELLSGSKGAPDRGLQSTTAALAAVLAAAQSADRTPPEQVNALYEQASANAKVQLTAWQTLKNNDLPKLNNQLRKAQLTPVPVSLPEN